MIPMSEGTEQSSNDHKDTQEGFVSLPSENQSTGENIPPLVPPECSTEIEGVHAPSSVFLESPEFTAFATRNIKNPELIRKHIFHETGEMPSPELIGLIIRDISKSDVQMSTAHAVIDPVEARAAALATAHRASEKAIAKYEETGSREDFTAWQIAASLVEKLTSSNSPSVQVNNQVNGGSPMMAKILKEVELDGS